jgi:hypothetical protein
LPTVRYEWRFDILLNRLRNGEYSMNTELVQLWWVAEEWIRKREEMLLRRKIECHFATIFNVGRLRSNWCAIIGYLRDFNDVIVVFRLWNAYKIQFKFKFCISPYLSQQHHSTTRISNEENLIIKIFVMLMPHADVHCTICKEREVKSSVWSKFTQFFKNKRSKKFDLRAKT